MNLQALGPLFSSAAFWLGSALLVGLLANQLPARWLGHGVLSASPSSPPGHGRSPVAGAPGIRIWKRWIPDAGGALPGGVPKASLVRRDPAALRRLVVETRRAELVHWALWPAGLLTALWLPPAGVLVNLVFATLFNLPCLLLQRFNRSRLRRCLARMGG
jgi:glycosyl-4,4'-diaponeurosporenoate acyltransferase